MDFIKKNIFWIIMGGLILATLGLFLPFASVSFLGYKQSVSFISADGKLVLICLIATAVLFYLKKEKISLIPIGIGAIITIYDSINVGKVLGEASKLVKATFGVGFYLVIIGIVVSLIALLYKTFKMEK